MLRRVLVCCLALLVSECARDSGTAVNSADPNTLVILAGSEVKDMEPMFADIEAKTGVHLAVQYSGTLAGIDRLETAPGAADVAWFAQDKYFALTDEHHLIKRSTKIMLSPVVMGVKASKVRELRWNARDITWAQIERAVAAGRLRYAMTNPATSNSGFSAVVSVATAFTGNGDVVSTSNLNQQRLTGFFSGQKLIAGSSGWLADAYVQSQDSIDGIVNYESVLLGLNHGQRLKEPLTLLYPKDGILTADYPMVLLNTAKSTAYDKVTAYLRSPAVQRAIMQNTYRRPVLASVGLSKDFPNQVLVDTSFPNNRGTVDRILLAYLNTHRIPGHAYFVIDTSGSMEGARLDAVKDAFHILTGSQNTLTARFARFDDREEVTIVPFAADVKDRHDFTMHGQDDRQTFGEIASYADSLSAGGGTAIYSALETALDEAQHDPPGRYDSIVLMTDGENNEGDSAEQFQSKYGAYGRKVRIFPIIFGEASPKELSDIADLSGGRAFDARSASLEDIFKEIRGYQ